ncbi:hypothetical protein WHR41_04432 [Cladosporium halotolerans]|uniref:Carboxylic ester hydrolase n=1 Tax=Cladosporium halotolerans TaxID=1052096 RepID=A0AB34KQG0_9PEZI
MLARLPLFTLLASAAAHPPTYGGHGPPGNDDLTVQTSSGRVHGKIDTTEPDVRQFLGIPFAHPPTGDLRWAAPQPLSQPDQDVEAKELGPSCMQFLNTNASSVYLNQVLEYNLQGLNRTGDISEDCLRLSVWAPNKGGHRGRGRGRGKEHGRGGKAETLPVLVYFYGGGFSTGGMDVPAQIPTQMVQRTQDHIVVSFNYRVNIFGHPNAPGLEDQNVGLLDQRAAVEWTRDNIAAFGGDPSRIVIWGQSAGSISVDYYSFTYPEDPIAAGMSLDSGTSLSALTSADTAQSNFTFVAENVGCGGFDDDASGRLSCMRGVDADKINDFIATYAKSAQQPALGFRPVVDDKVVFSNYSERMLQGKQAKIPAIIGTNTEDGVPFAPYDPSGPDPALAEQGLLRTFFCPATESARLRQQTGLDTYRYLYAGNWTNLSPAPWLGAFHSAELPMLFGTHPNFRGESTELEYETSHAMQDAWVAFAREGVRGLQSEGWKEYEAVGEATVREFGDGVAAKDVSIAGLEGKCDGAVPA